MKVAQCDLRMANTRMRLEDLGEQAINTSAQSFGVFVIG